MRSTVLPLLLLAACPAPEAPVPGTLPDPGPVLLTADGYPLHKEVLDVAMDKVPPDQLEQLKASGQYTKLVEQMALGEVLYHRALDEKFQDQRDVQLKMAIAQRDALAQAYIQSVADKAVTDEALRAAYEERKVRYATPSVSTRIAIAPSADAAQKIVDAARAGLSLDDAAKEGGSPAPVQDMGWAPKGQLSPAIDGLVFADGAPEQGILDPIALGNRHIVLEVVARRPNTPFEEVEEELRQELEQEAIRTFTQELQTKTKIAWTDGAKAEADQAAEAEAAE